jgi:hypothetical protein
MQNSVLTTKLLLTGHSSAARQCQTSFWVVLYSFSYGGWRGEGLAKLWEQMRAASAGESENEAGSTRQHESFLMSDGSCVTCVDTVADRSTETLLAIVKVCILPSTTIICDCCGYVLLLKEGHTGRCQSLWQFVAYWCSQIRSRVHGSTSTFASGFAEEMKLNLW